MRKALLLAIAALLFSMNVVNAKEIQVKGYTKKDGTKVAGYTRTVKDKDDKAAAPETEKVAGYTKKDGTKVAGYTRKVKAKDPTDGAMATGAASNAPKSGKEKDGTDVKASKDSAKESKKDTAKDSKGTKGGKDSAKAPK